MKWRKTAVKEQSPSEDEKKEEGESSEAVKEQSLEGKQENITSSSVVGVDNASGVIQSTSEVSGPVSQDEDGRQDHAEVSRTSSDNTVTEETSETPRITEQDTPQEVQPAPGPSTETAATISSAPEEKQKLLPGFLSRLSTAASPTSSNTVQQDGVGNPPPSTAVAKQGFFSGISNHINCMLPSTPQTAEADDYKDVVLKVHVRLHR